MKHFILLSLLFLPLCVSAQEEEKNYYYIIPRAGVTFSTMTGKAVDAKMRPGFMAGVDFDADLKGPWGFRAGLYFASLGAKDAASIEYHQIAGRLDTYKVYSERHDWVMPYLNIPLQMVWHPVKNLSVMTGFQFGFRLNGGNDKKHHYGTSNNSWASIPVGASYDFGPLMLDVHYNFGLTVLSDSKEQHLNALMVSLGYKIKCGIFKNKKPESKFHLPEIGH